MRKAGFTIVELTLYMGLLAIFLVVLSDLFLTVLDAQAESQSLSTIQQDGRYLLARLAYDVGRATTVSQPPLSSSGSSLELLISGQPYLYQLNQGALTLSVNGSPVDQLSSLATTVSAVTFSHFGNGSGIADTVQVNFTLVGTTKRPWGFESQQFTTILGLRPN